MVRVTDRARNDLKCVEGPQNRNQTIPNLAFLDGFAVCLHVILLMLEVFHCCELDQSLLKLNNNKNKYMY